MKLQRAGYNISGLVFIGMWSENKWKGFCDPRKRRHYNVLCITLFPSLSLFFSFSLSRSISRNRKAAVVRESSQHDTCWSRKGGNRDAGTRGFEDFYRDGTPSGCLDILRDILRHIRAVSFIYTPALYQVYPRLFPMPRPGITLRSLTSYRRT